MKIRQQCIIYLVALLLAGCGYHLRGMLEMPRWFNHVSIITDNANRDLAPLLNGQLKAYQINVCADPSLAAYWLIIEEDSFQQQVGSISSSTTPRQYQLFYSVQFKLQQAKGKEILPSTRIMITRQVTLNSDRILGSTNEEDLTKTEMQREAAMRIIDRLSRIHEH